MLSAVAAAPDLREIAKRLPAAWKSGLRAAERAVKAAEARVANAEKAIGANDSARQQVERRIAEARQSRAEQIEQAAADLRAGREPSEPTRDYAGLIEAAALSLKNFDREAALLSDALREVERQLRLSEDRLAVFTLGDACARLSEVLSAVGPSLERWHKAEARAESIREGQPPAVPVLPARWAQALGGLSDIAKLSGRRFSGGGLNTQYGAAWAYAVTGGETFLSVLEGTHDPDPASGGSSATAIDSVLAWLEARP